MLLMYRCESSPIKYDGGYVKEWRFNLAIYVQGKRYIVCDEGAEPVYVASFRSFSEAFHYVEDYVGGMEDAGVC